jgi:type I restriction enzyme, S subunit
MNAEWRTVPIGSLCTGIFDGPHATPKKTGRGPVFLGISSLNRGRLDHSSFEHLSDEDFAKWTKRVVPREDDIVFSYETRLGEVALLPAGLRCCLGRRMALMRIDRSKAVPEYVVYAFMSPEFQNVIRARTIHGSTVDRLPLSDFGSFPIPVPSLRVQREVVSVLRALDDRIALLRETNVTLETIAQALFKSWFVDFDPVRAKRQGLVPTGMDEATAALFPHEFEESTLGMMPKGWRVEALQDLLVLQRGFDLPAQDRVPGAFPIIAASGPSGTHVEAMAKGPGVVTGRSGVLGRVFLELGDYWPLNTSLWVKEFRAATPCFAYELLRCLDFKSFNTGSAVPTLNRNHVHGLPYVIPSRACVEAYEAIALLLHERARVNDLRAQTLAKLRDTLLPRLTSGRLRLPEVEVFA